MEREKREEEHEEEDEEHEEEEDERARQRLPVLLEVLDAYSDRGMSDVCVAVASDAERIAAASGQTLVSASGVSTSRGSSSGATRARGRNRRHRRGRGRAAATSDASFAHSGRAPSEIVQLCRESTTALAWLTIDATHFPTSESGRSGNPVGDARVASQGRPQQQWQFLLRGTRNGSLCIYTPRLEKLLIEDIHIHDSPVEDIVVRSGGPIVANRPSVHHQNEICISCGYILAVIPLCNLVPLLIRGASHDVKPPIPSSPTIVPEAATDLVVARFDISARVGVRSGAYVAGRVLPQLYEAFETELRIASEGHKAATRHQAPPFNILTCGADPPIASFSADDSSDTPTGGGVLQRRGVETSADGIRIKPVVPARHCRSVSDRSLHASVSSSIASSPGASAASPSRIAASLLSSVSNFGGGGSGRGHASRSVTGIVPAPCAFGAVGTSLSACTDTFGRVLLVDAATTAILRIWKGYRYAQLAWTRASQGSTIPSGTHTTHDTDDGGALLVMYAPLKRRIEVWKPLGARLAVFAVEDEAGAPLLASNTSMANAGEGASRFFLASVNMPILYSQHEEEDADDSSSCASAERGNVASTTTTTPSSSLGAVFLVDCSRFNVDAIQGVDICGVGFISV